MVVFLILSILDLGDIQKKYPLSFEMDILKCPNPNMAERLL
jgi:hypothetical protein